MNLIIAPWWILLRQFGYKPDSANQRQDEEGKYLDIFQKIGAKEIIREHFKWTNCWFIDRKNGFLKQDSRSIL